MSGLGVSIKVSDDPVASFRDLSMSRMDDDDAAETFERWKEHLGSNVKEFSTSSMSYDAETVHTSHMVTFKPMFDHDEIIAVAEAASVTEGEIELVHDYDKSPHFTIFWNETAAS